MIIIVMGEHDDYDHDNHVLKVGDLFDCRPAINRAFHHCKNVANKVKNKVNKCFFSKKVFFSICEQIFLSKYFDRYVDEGSVPIEISINKAVR